ncbi:MAG: Transcriptional regulator PadR-like family [Sphingomonadales bacterium]|jgi:DNA-binding PadR family transcriptional regulator|nr:Transcriptional regulator PadR-like family [Sphingomonadales bacterium]
MIGKFEELVLLACIRAGDKALPSAIYQRLLAGQKTAAFGALYTTLGRMADKKLVAEVAITDGKSRERRAFTITGEGQKALRDALEASRAIGGIAEIGGIGACPAL